MNQFQKFYNDNKDTLKVFCEIGVYRFDHCRLHQQINDGKTVILVEPLNGCVQDIKNNTKDKSNVTIHQVAITDKVGETTIYNEGPSAFIEEVRGVSPCHKNEYYDVPNRRQPQPHELEKIKTTTFDKIDSRDIDVLLIDTEGCEYYVLQNLISRPKIIAVEIKHERYTNPKQKEIFEWMDNNAYESWFNHDADVYFKKKE